MSSLTSLIGVIFVVVTCFAQDVVMTPTFFHYQPYDFNRHLQHFRNRNYQFWHELYRSNFDQRPFLRFTRPNFAGVEPFQPSPALHDRESEDISNDVYGYRTPEYPGAAPEYPTSTTEQRRTTRPRTTYTTRERTTPSVITPEYYPGTPVEQGANYPVTPATPDLPVVPTSELQATLSPIPAVPEPTSTSLTTPEQTATTITALSTTPATAAPQTEPVKPTKRPSRKPTKRPLSEILSSVNKINSTAQGLVNQVNKPKPARSEGLWTTERVEAADSVESESVSQGVVEDRVQLVEVMSPVKEDATTAGLESSQRVESGEGILTIERNEEVSVETSEKKATQGVQEEVEVNQKLEQEPTKISSMAEEEVTLKSSLEGETEVLKADTEERTEVPITSQDEEEEEEEAIKTSPANEGSLAAEVDDLRRELIDDAESKTGTTVAATLEGEEEPSSFREMPDDLKDEKPEDLDEELFRLEMSPTDRNELGSIITEMETEASLDEELDKLNDDDPSSDGVSDDPATDPFTTESPLDTTTVAPESTTIEEEPEDSNSAMLEFILDELWNAALDLQQLLNRLTDPLALSLNVEFAQLNSLISGTKNKVQVTPYDADKINQQVIRITSNLTIQRVRSNRVSIKKQRLDNLAKLLKLNVENNGAI